ncbi:MAG: hypothetical protein EPN20_13195, partial [Magnetospirillum sp.]
MRAVAPFCWSPRSSPPASTRPGLTSIVAAGIASEVGILSFSPHLWLALSPHGFGHAAMTAPVVTELRRRRPGLRLTIQTGVPRAFLESR